MHELAVTQNILEVVLKEARSELARRVTDVYLVNGPLSGMADDAIRFYWRGISRDTVCDGAELHFERISADLVCRDCGQAFITDQPYPTCPGCQSSRLRAMSGEHLQLKSIEVEFPKGYSAPKAE